MKSPRILITRLSHIGDCLLTIPMLNAIRELNGVIEVRQRLATLEEIFVACTSREEPIVRSSEPKEMELTS